MKNLDVITEKINKVRKIFLDFQKSGDLKGCTIDCEIKVVNIPDDSADIFVWVFLKNFDDYNKFLKFDKRLMIEFGRHNYILFPKDSLSAYKIPSEKFRGYRLVIDYFEYKMKKFDNYLSFKLYFANNGRFYINRKYKKNNVEGFCEEEFFKALKEKCDIGYHNDAYNTFLEKVMKSDVIVRLTNIWDTRKVMRELNIDDGKDVDYYLFVNRDEDDYDVLSTNDDEFKKIKDKHPDTIDDADFVKAMEQYNEQYLL